MKRKIIYLIIISVILLFVINCASSKKWKQRKLEAQINYNTGIRYLNEKKYDLALNYLLRANELLPNDPMILNGLGLVYLGKGNAEVAQSYFEKAIKINDDIPEIHNNLSSAYIMLKRYEDAIKEADKALSDPLYMTPAYALFNKAMAYKGLNQIDKAIENLKRVIENSPANFVAHYQLANLYFEKKNYTKAIHHYRKCVELREDYWEGYWGLANAFYKNKQISDAVRILNHLIKNAPPASEIAIKAQALLDKLVKSK